MFPFRGYFLTVLALFITLKQYFLPDTDVLGGNNGIMVVCAVNLTESALAWKIPV